MCVSRRRLPLPTFTDLAVAVLAAIAAAEFVALVLVLS